MLGAVKKICPAARSGVPLSSLTTFRVGGPVGVLTAPENTGELDALLRLADSRGMPLLVLGRGSNILASDSGLPDTLALSTSMLREKRFDGGSVFADCGVPLPELAKLCCARGLDLSWAVGIPGSLGGAVVMNAGAYGGTMADVVKRVWVWDGGTVREISRHDFAYRHSVYMDNPEWFVLRAELCPPEGEARELQARADDLLKRRREKQPIELPSAGSFFKRPEGNFAGALIESSGLKGYKYGGAAVSDKHAGFIVNLGGASCEDILTLARHVVKTVLAETGVRLEPEVRLVGERWNL